MIIATSVTSVVVTVLWQQCPRQHCDSSGLDSTVTAMPATLVCRRCTLTTLQQRWQWQLCNITVHISVTAVSTDSAMTAMFTLVWQRCAHHCESIVATDGAVKVLSVSIVVTQMCIWWSQHCHYHCCPSAFTVSTVTLLSEPSLPHRCARFHLPHCHSAVLVALPQTMCTLVSIHCGIPPL